MIGIMTKKWKTFWIVGLFLLILTGIRLLWISFDTISDHPRAVQGVLDLQEWNFQNKPIVTLDGEWDFYPNKFLTPGSANGMLAQTEKKLLEVPGTWQSAFPDQDGYGQHFGTYRLRVLLDDTMPAAFGVRLQRIFAASEIIVNGQSIGHAGKPAESSEKSTMRNIPYSVFFTPDRKELEILIYTSFYGDYKQGGIVQPLLFGEQTAVEKKVWTTNSMQLMMSVVLFIHAAYAVILYWIGTREKGFLLFGALVLFTGLSVLVDDDSLLYTWMPYSYEWALKVFFLTYIGVFTFLYALAAQLSELLATRIHRWFYTVCIAYVLFVLMLPAQTVLQANGLLLLLAVPTAFLLPIMVYRTIKKNKQDAIFLLLGATAITSNVIWGSLKNRYWVDLTYYPFDLIAAFLAFATFWFKRYFRTAAQTEDLAKRLQKEDRQKDEFLANTSHELRNPLHGMLSIAQSVLDREEAKLEAQSKKRMELLITVGRRMTLMLNDLLDVTRLKEGRIRLEARPISVQSVASGVLDMLRFMTEGKAVHFQMNIPDSFPRVMADENRLVQILFNLLHNAVKFTETGTIAISASIVDGKACIHVTDTGIGMDEETQHKIFGAYVQGDAAITAIGGGLGLGLSICKQLVEMHKGTLRVQSVLGQGTQFTFSLPLSEAAADEVAAAGEKKTGLVVVEAVQAEDNESLMMTEQLHNSKAADCPKILIVDDDPVNVSILSSILSTEGYEIVTATSGKEALALLHTGKWNLVITDVMMPHMSGYELSQVIRRRLTISELPILLLTARSHPEDVATGFLSGASDYVTKPVDTLELKVRVRALIELKQSVAERLRMEAAWLQAQIKPHFFFNTLNSLAILSDMDTAKMKGLLEEFSAYLQKSFDFQNSDEVIALEQELELVRSYLSIEKARYGEKLNIVWDVDDSISLKVPPLSIQPLVENALAHGLLKRVGMGNVRIRIHGLSEGTRIQIEDDGVGMNAIELEGCLAHQPTKRRGVGLYNTDRRLKQLYGKGLDIQSTPDVGTTVTFEIPKIQEIKSG